jgi:predicted amidohydrolase
MVKLSLIQLRSSTDITANLAIIAKYLAQITTELPRIEKSQDTDSKVVVTHLVVLPECCLYFGGKESEQLVLAKKSAAKDDLRAALAQLAAQFNVYLVAGSIPVVATTGEKFTNTSCMFCPDGKLMGQYDKIHLFDVKVSDSTKAYCESRFTQAGKEICLVKAGFANIGLTICFDLRFPKLFQQLAYAGADIISVPSAFTQVTGKAHWQTLLQARAIENQVYIIAAGQEGRHDNGRETWGHSMIINPWGEIEQCIEVGEGYISVDYQPKKLTEIRQRMPLKSPLNQ